ncbi:histidinol-phosphate transaminase [Thauera linaloolentis]|uniref:Histidinol-phosphate aminotransferase n=1 Tax=Thauera linaloolentis (strain DSM 12138 / JCM 21573 / CCUG 41526 / CIP 105981 / IAM 15112 / NBRC 102519 / 47Lol) TaxID=1123367 RepID=N6ZD76_THAL4|nr:histidinol-phosphate transaminase [Thauera linaloolentis]ENO90139.1 histidinol-phosphate aminotransferase [Thauera linaloolentis 47Lol = DSM 12138]MCM8564723.1 histidinol-phosphate transaminase [Thauera linaloolentis]
MSVASHAPDHIRAITPYQPGKPISELAREMGIAEASIVKLASNENPLGMSTHARDAARAALGDLARYPDGGAFALKAALCRKFGVGPEQLVIGNGSNDILEIAAQAFLGPGCSAVYAQHAFAVYPLATQARGARGIEVPAKHFGHDLGAMAAAICEDTRIVFIANPNNPTGTFLPGAQIEAFLNEVPQDVLVVLDEAYTEYLSPAQRYDAIAWIGRFPNLLVSRTFSKAYGLAGLRVGYGIAHAEVADLMNRVRQPFNVSSVALAAAEAALEDEEFLAQSAELNRRGMLQLTEAFSALGLEWIPSAGNFVTFKIGDAAGINRALLQQGVIVRPIAGYGMPHWLRVSIGLPEENARFIAALKQAMA